MFLAILASRDGEVKNSRVIRRREKRLAKEILRSSRVTAPLALPVKGVDQIL
jgi:hypothetical protein